MIAKEERKKKKGQAVEKRGEKLVINIPGFFQMTLIFPLIFSGHDK